MSQTLRVGFLATKIAMARFAEADYKCYKAQDALIGSARGAEVNTL